MSDLPRWPRTPSSDQPYSRQAARQGLPPPRRHRHRGPLPLLRRGLRASSSTPRAAQLIDIEGNPESPINEGTLCPKGANTFQLAVNPHRVTEVLLPRPVLGPLGDAVARLGARPHRRAGEGSARRRLHRTRRPGPSPQLGDAPSARLGGATIDNEENYLIKKLFAGGLGVVSIENQARI